jgi:hypothetical protein
MRSNSAMTSVYTVLVRPQLKFLRPIENGLESQHSCCVNRSIMSSLLETL